MERAIALKQIENVRSQLIKKYKPEKIILFGFAAWGKDEINDIDLFIIKRDIPYYEADRIIELYRMMDVNAPVDFIVFISLRRLKRGFHLGILL